MQTTIKIGSSSSHKPNKHSRTKSQASVNFHDSDEASGDDTFMARGDNNSKTFDFEQQTRLKENSHLSALTSQIMELIIDNIRMVHMNTKLIEYCKQQSQQAQQTKTSLMQTIEGEQTVKIEVEDRVKDLKLELDEKYEKVSLYLLNNRFFKLRLWKPELEIPSLMVLAMQC